MNLQTLLERAQFYHPNQITRLVRMGTRIVFYGGMADESQFAMDLGLECPIFERLKMPIEVRPNFIAEIISEYKNSFPLIALLKVETINGVYLTYEHRILVSTIDAFTKWAKNKNNMWFATETKIEWAVTHGDYLPWKDGYQVTNAILSRTIFEI